MKAKIALDLMGSDRSPEVLLKGAITAIQRSEDALEVTLVATPQVVKDLSSKVRGIPEISWVEAPEVIAMDSIPIQAVRKHKKSSIVQAIRMVAKKEVDACVSAGNTGALFFSAFDQLGIFPKISRPALTALIPTKHGSMALLDAGANVQCRASHLIHFAILGALFQKFYHGIDAPKVGLLNIGSESTKGTKALQETYAYLTHLKNPPYEFIGNIEGRNAFSESADVLVTDGFTGNIFLKTAEGASEFLLSTMDAYDQLDEVKKTFAQRFDFGQSPGAVLCGVNGVVMKCHGDASSDSISQSIQSAAKQVGMRVVEKMTKSLSLLN